MATKSSIPQELEELAVRARLARIPQNKPSTPRGGWTFFFRWEM
jgi:hypothetical protein